MAEPFTFGWDPFKKKKKKPEEIVMGPPAPGQVVVPEKKKPEPYGAVGLPAPSQISQAYKPTPYGFPGYKPTPPAPAGEPSISVYPKPATEAEIAEAQRRGWERRYPGISDLDRQRAEQEAGIQAQIQELITQETAGYEEAVRGYYSKLWHSRAEHEQFLEMERVHKENLAYIEAGRLAEVTMMGETFDIQREVMTQGYDLGGLLEAGKVDEAQVKIGDYRAVLERFKVFIEGLPGPEDAEGKASLASTQEWIEQQLGNLDTTETEIADWKRQVEEGAGATWRPWAATFWTQRAFSGIMSGLAWAQETIFAPWGRELWHGWGKPKTPGEFFTAPFTRPSATELQERGELPRLYTKEQWEALSEEERQEAMRISQEYFTSWRGKRHEEYEEEAPKWFQYPAEFLHPVFFLPYGKLGWVGKGLQSRVALIPKAGPATARILGYGGKGVEVLAGRGFKIKGYRVPSVLAAPIEWPLRAVAFIARWTVIPGARLAVTKAILPAIEPAMTQIARVAPYIPITEAGVRRFSMKFAEAKWMYKPQTRVYVGKELTEDYTKGLYGAIADPTTGMIPAREAEELIRGGELLRRIKGFAEGDKAVIDMAPEFLSNQEAKFVQKLLKDADVPKLLESLHTPLPDGSLVSAEEILMKVSRQVEEHLSSKHGVIKEITVPTAKGIRQGIDIETVAKLSSEELQAAIREGTVGLRKLTQAPNPWYRAMNMTKFYFRPFWLTLRPAYTVNNQISNFFWPLMRHGAYMLTYPETRRFLLQSPKIMLSHVRFEVSMARIERETLKKFGPGLAYRTQMQKEISRLTGKGIKPIPMQEVVEEAITATGVPANPWVTSGFNLTQYTTGLEAMRGAKVHFLQKIPIVGWLDESLQALNRGGEALGHIIDYSTGLQKWFNASWPAAVDDLARAGAIPRADARLWRSARSVEDVRRLCGKKVVSRDAIDYSRLPDDAASILKSKIDALPAEATRKDMYKAFLETQAEVRVLYQDKADMVLISRGIPEEIEVRIAQDTVDVLGELRLATDNAELITAIDTTISKEAALGREFNVKFLTKRKEQMLKRKTVERMAHQGIDIPEFAIYEKASYEHDKKVVWWLFKRKEESSRWYEELRGCRTAEEMDWVNVRHYRVAANLAKKFDEGVDRIWDNALKEMRRKLPDISPDAVIADLQVKFPVRARPPEAVLPKPVEGMPEAGLQVRFTPEGKLVQERFVPKGKGEVTQIGMEDYAKYQEAMAGKARVPKPEVPRVPITEAELEGKLGSKPWQLLTDIVSKSGKWEGKFPETITKEQARLILRKEPLANTLTPDGKRVYWIDILDSLASELGFEGPEQLVAHVEYLLGQRAYARELGLLEAQRFAQQEVTKLERWGAPRIKPIEVRAADSQARIAEILASKMAPDEKVRELRAILTEMGDDVTRTMGELEAHQQVISFDPVIQNVEYKRVPTARGKGEPIEMVRYTYGGKGKWYKLEEAPLDEWGTELGIREATAIAGHELEYTQVLRNRIREIPRVKRELETLKAEAKQLDRFASDYQTIKKGADDLERAVLTKRFNNLEVELDMATREGASDDVIDTLLRQMGEVDDQLRSLPPAQGEIMFDEVTAMVTSIAEKPKTLPDDVITQTIEKEGLGLANPLKPVDDIGIIHQEMTRRIAVLDDAWGGFIDNTKALTKFSGANPEAMIPKFNDAMMNSSRKALSQAKIDLFDYSMRTQFDYMLQHLFPFPFWNTRFALLIATRCVENPGQLAAFANLLKRWGDDTADLPWSMQFSVKLITLDDGSEIRFRPFTFFFPLGYSVADIMRVGSDQRRIRDLSDACELISNMVGGYFYPPIELMAGLIGGEAGVRERYGLFRPPGEALKGIVPQIGLLTETLGGTGLAEKLLTSGALSQWQKNRIFYALNYAVNEGEITQEQAREAAQSIFDSKPNEIAVRYIQKALGQERGKAWASYMGLPVSLFTPEKQAYMEEREYREEKLPYGIPHTAEEWDEYQKKFPGSVVMEFVPPADLKPELKQQWTQTVNYWAQRQEVTDWRMAEQEKLDVKFVEWFKLTPEERALKGLPENVGNWWRDERRSLWERTNGRVMQLDSDSAYAEANKTREQTATFQQALGRETIPIHPFTAALDGYYAVDIDNPEYQALGGSASSKAWDKFYRDREDYLLSLSSAEKEYVLKRIMRNRTALEDEYYKAQDVLKPYWELTGTIEGENKYPRDTDEQTEWVLKAMRVAGPQGEANAIDYEWMLDAREEKNPAYDQLRSLTYFDSLFRWAEQLRLDIPTVGQIVGAKRQEMRRENPELDAYGVLFYGWKPI